MTAKHAKQVVRRTLKLIEKDGWCKNKLYDYKTGRRCLLGLLEEVEPNFSRRLDVIRLLRFATTTDVWEWNDRPRRRRHDVIERLQKALE